MPLTKQYLKYVSGSCLGVVCSRKTGSLLLEKRYGNDRKWYSVSPALENVIIWDLKSGEKVHTVLIPKHTSLGLRLFLLSYTSLHLLLTGMGFCWGKSRGYFTR